MKESALSWPFWGFRQRLDLMMLQGSGFRIERVAQQAMYDREDEAGQERKGWERGREGRVAARGGVQVTHGTAPRQQ